MYENGTRFVYLNIMPYVRSVFVTVPVESKTDWQGMTFLCKVTWH